MRSDVVNGSLDASRPFVVAHRAGNDITRLRAAAALSLPLAEADVHLYRGRLEVRHLKTAGPLPVLWDRWELASRRRPRLLLEHLLAVSADAPELMLDLKGHDLRLPERVLEAVARARVHGRITVCSQDWRLLEPLRAVPEVRVIHSVGNARALRRLRDRFGGETLAGVSIHNKLLDATTAGDLRERAELLLSWPVENVADARRLAGLGVQGLISQAFETIAAALAAAVPQAQATAA